MESTVQHSSSVNNETVAMTTPLLPRETFTAAITALPLVSVDICLTDETGNLLLGQRNNAPAKNWWFTPGGRIRKNESLALALVRVVQEELGLPFEIPSRAILMGAWDHFYPDSAYDSSVSTHYVNLPHWLTLSASEAHKISPPQGQNQQHICWQWLPLHQAVQDSTVHPYVQTYARLLLERI